MTNKLRVSAVTLGILVSLFLLYRLLFIRVVNYEIGGIKIPSEYNFFTGKVKPILDYKGKPITRTVEDRKSGNLGLTEKQVVLAQFRWAVFEEWVKAHPEYKGWESNPEIFKKAQSKFRKELESHGPRIVIIK